MTPHLALLRGINVGGSNIIKMAALKACFEHMGFSDVATYIQSGNVIFRAPRASRAQLTRTIEDALSRQFKYKSSVVVVSLDVLKRVVKEAPGGFGSSPGTHRYDVIFVKPPTTPGRVVKAVELKAGVDDVAAGRHALYFSRLISKATQSRLSRLVLKPEYQRVTMRNWNTTTKLLEILTR